MSRRPVEARADIVARLRRQGRSRRADPRRRRRERPVGRVPGERGHRPPGHLQLGPLPDGRQRLAGGAPRVWQRERDRSRDGDRGRHGGPPHPGARRRERHRPVPPGGAVPRGPSPAGDRRRPELPDGRPHRRRVPPEPRGDRHGLRARGRSHPDRRRARPPHDPVRLLRGRRPGDGGRRCRRPRLPCRAHDRRRDRRDDGLDARRVCRADLALGGGGRRGPSRHPRAVPWRPDLDAGGRRLRPLASARASTASMAPRRWSACRWRWPSPPTSAPSARPSAGGETGEA